LGHGALPSCVFDRSLIARGGLHFVLREALIGLLIAARSG
jgi:hypothetical protein